MGIQSIPITGLALLGAALLAADESLEPTRNLVGSIAVN
jgi:hypothetical protein